MGPIDAHVAGLARALHGPRRMKAELVTEARDSLVDAASAYESDGLSRTAAERLAVAEFGDIAEIAPEYQAELGLAQTKRTALLVFTLLVAQTVAWGPARSSVLGPPADGFLDDTIGWVGFATMVGAVAAIIALRYAPSRRALTLLAGRSALGMSAIMALMGISTTLLNNGHLLWTVAFGVLPMAWTASSAHRCLRAARGA